MRASTMGRRCAFGSKNRVSPRAPIRPSADRQRNKKNLEGQVFLLLNLGVFGSKIEPQQQFLLAHSPLFGLREATPVGRPAESHRQPTTRPSAYREGRRGASTAPHRDRHFFGRMPESHDMP